MKEEDPGTRDDVEKLLRAANHYALERIELCLAEDEGLLARPGHVAEVGFRFVNQYLFPNLEADELEALNVLALARRKCEAAVNVAHVGMTLSEAIVHDRRVRKMEHAFLAARDRALRCGLTRKLTTIQRDVLRREFLTVVFNG